MLATIDVFAFLGGTTSSTPEQAAYPMRSAARHANSSKPQRRSTGSTATKARRPTGMASKIPGGPARDSREQRGVERRRAYATAARSKGDVPGGAGRERGAIDTTMRRGGGPGEGRGSCSGYHELEPLFARRAPRVDHRLRPGGGYHVRPAQPERRVGWRRPATARAPRRDGSHHRGGPAEGGIECDRGDTRHRRGGEHGDIIRADDRHLNHGRA